MAAPQPLRHILTVAVTATNALYLAFSDGTAGEINASWLAGKSGSVLGSLHDPAVFARACVDSGGLCWPNGLELSAETVGSWLDAQGRLNGTDRAA